MDRSIRPGFGGMGHPKGLDPTVASQCADLCDQVGKKVMAVQKDGKNFIGILISVDHYGNMFLREAVERICVGGRNGQFGDVAVGTVLVRGDSLALAGEIGNEMEGKMLMKKVSPELILKLQQDENNRRAEKDQKISKGLKDRGMAYKSTYPGFPEDI